MNYQQARQYINSFYNFEKDSKPKMRYYNLERIRKLAALFGDPQDTFPSVHITGTKGKGSTCAMTANILKCAGYKVGLYASPHLMDVRERIMLNGVMIPKKDFANVLSRIRTGLKKLGQDFRPSYFEVMTAAAFMYFAEKRVDIAVIEVGMGGRLDATNIIRPLVTCITAIGYDHTKELGGTLRKIAREKAGIIKRGIPCVSSKQPDEAAKVLARVCRSNGARLITPGKPIKMRLGLCGPHQKSNAALARAIIEVLKEKGYRVPDTAVARGLRTVTLPGRCQIITGNPTVVLDAAHTAESVKAFIDTVKTIFRGREAVLIFGAAKDKDIKAMSKRLSVFARDVVLTRIGSSRTAEPEDMSVNFSRNRVTLAHDPAHAYEIALNKCAGGDIIAVTGSFYLAGEISGILIHDKNVK